MAEDTNWFWLQKLPLKLRERLLPFQKEGIDFGIKKNGRCIIADEMGLGKTLQAISIMYYFKKDWPVLIVLPSSLKYSWVEEIEKWIPELQPGEICIIKSAVDLFRNSRVDMIKFVTEARFGCAILDESHTIKNGNTNRTKAMVKIMRGIKHVVLLSGTPSLARPEELYSQIKIVKPSLVGSFQEFAEQFCDGHFSFAHVGHGKVIRQFKTKGASNLEELHDILKSHVMIRRVKKKVLTQLPSKRRQRVLFEISEESRFKEDLNSYKANILKYRKLLDTQLSSINDSELVSMHHVNHALTRLYSITGLAKAAAVQQFISDLIEGITSKIVVFCYHLEMVNAVAELLATKTVKNIVITGSVDSKTRNELVHQFQTDIDCRVAVLSITAACTGLTLTAADNVVFAELHWTPGIMLQAEDRCHRIGQDNPVQVHYLVAKGTIDESLWGMLLRKISVTSITLDGAIGDLKIDKECTDEQKKLESCRDRLTTSEQQADESLSCYFSQQPLNKMHGSRDIRDCFKAKEKEAAIEIDNDNEKDSQTIHRPSEDDITASPRVFTNLFPPLLPAKNQDISKTVCSSETVCTSSNVPQQEHKKAECVVSIDTPGCSFTEKTLPKQSEFVTENVWKCTMCTFLNHADLSYCEICERQRCDQNISNKTDTDYKKCNRTSLNVCNTDTPSLTVLEAVSTIGSDESESDADDESDDGSDGDDFPVFNIGAAMTKIKAQIKEQQAKRSLENADVPSQEKDDDSIQSITNPSQSSVAIKSTELINDFEFSDDDLDDLDLNEIDQVELNLKLNMPGCKIKLEKVDLHFCMSPYTDRFYLYDDEKKPYKVNMSICELHSQTDLPEEICSIDCWSQIQKFLMEWNSLGMLQQSVIQSSHRIFKSPCTIQLDLREVKEKTSFKRFQDLESLIVRAKKKAADIGGSVRILGQGTVLSSKNDQLLIENGVPQVVDPGGKPLCLSCFKKIFVTGVALLEKYCSSKCQQDFQVKCHRRVVRDRLRLNEKGECQMCHFNALDAFHHLKALPKRQRKAYLITTPYSRFPVSRLNRMIDLPMEGKFWEADHIQAVSEGGGECGIENYRTLCTPCHLDATNELMKRLREKRKRRIDETT